MKKHLYDIFADKWYRGGTIYLIGDTHFGDLESYKFRFPEKFNLVEEDYISVCSNPKTYIDWQYERHVEELDQMQIDNINKACGKNDTLVILGDVGNIECVKKLKAGYKVLIIGNHDRGASSYKRVKKLPTILLDNKEASVCPKCGSHEVMLNINNTSLYNDKSFFTYRCDACGISLEDNNIKRIKIIDNDNHLFDEVYEGTLQISPKIILSHEPVDYPYCLNIHGHNHNVNPLGAYTEGIGCTSHYNCCAEQINYKPVSLKSIVESGSLKDVKDIHRETIDRRLK